jgi:hypothetical protein
MNLRKGDIYICTEPCCRAEIEVRRGADPACPGKFTLRCCCGKEMAREDMLEFAKPAAAKRETAASRK